MGQMPGRRRLEDGCRLDRRRRPFTRPVQAESMAGGLRNRVRLRDGRHQLSEQAQRDRKEVVNLKNFGGKDFCV